MYSKAGVVRKQLARDNNRYNIHQCRSSKTVAVYCNHCSRYIKGHFVHVFLTEFPAERSTCLRARPGHLSFLKQPPRTSFSLLLYRTSECTSGYAQRALRTCIVVQGWCRTLKISLHPPLSFPYHVVNAFHDKLYVHLISYKTKN